MESNSGIQRNGQMLERILANQEKTRTSAALGVEGQDWVLQVLKEAFPPLTCSVTVMPTSGQPHRGDFCLTFHNQQGMGGQKLKIMVEVKNCQGTVPADQRRRFLSDALRTDICRY